MSVKTDLIIFLEEMGFEFDVSPEQVINDIDEILSIEDLIPKENHSRINKIASIPELRDCVDDSDLKEYDKGILKFLLGYGIIDNLDDLNMWIKNIILNKMDEKE